MEMGSLADFIEKYGITSSWKSVQGPAPSKEWPAGTHHYSVTLRRAMTMKDGGALMTVSFHKGLALKEPPSTSEVLDTLAMDSSLYENSKDVEDLMSEIGEDNYMRAKKLYNAIEKQAQKLGDFLGDEAYKELLWDTERG